MSKQVLPVVDLQAVACCSPIAVRPLEAEQAAVVAPMFKALGDPIRLRLMSMIASVPEICVCDLTPAFDLSGPTISHHLKVLREAGLVDSDRRGTWVWYRARPEAFRQLGALLDLPAGSAQATA
ncbi:metalloregulator ArsR/SmtB family transcription factor [Micromonospora sp. DSM 115977]|uniref:Metalloregulator ArsR/SmtB family transcription factor n=1 Tax=Micromonospora reichwaldensis TaxID=3075516 RepID=A0ABU2WRT9_9ACTN|nr:MULTISPECIES: metalloregulator ArsR/SmtB family transcription factor [unclassified Micromonospora]KAB1159221.1 helix-turn-helix transcriptional regulator [Micromonospora sp. AMSO12t]MDT0528612.1 metalloregulator ArsR/SmtB family transcription factor [Micromonospora sp. DSM 115977]